MDAMNFCGLFTPVVPIGDWFRREVRAVRLGHDIRSYRDAQGFRVGPALRRVRARQVGARMFHYGWARPLQSMRRKLVAAQDVFPQHADRLAARAAQPEALGWTPLLRRFTGAHPDAAQSWIAPRRAASAGWGRGARQLRLWPLRAFGVGLGEGPTR